MRLFRQTGLILLAAAVCAVPGAVAQAGYSSPVMATIAEQYLLSAANQERAARGLGELHRDVKLAHAATDHAQRMAEHGSISHQFAGEAELTDRGASAGVAFSTISENVAEAPSSPWCKW